MMNLHKDKELFNELINRVSNDYNLNESIVKKDYFVTLVLKQIVLNDNSFVFKGGTSLSKCFNLINRFSEDIDLSYINSKNLDKLQRKAIKQTIINAVEGVELSVLNLTEIRSGRDFNRYIVNYDCNDFNLVFLKQNIVIETSFQEEPFPIENKECSSLIEKWLSSNNHFDIIKQYQLEPFSTNVQSYTRTFIDKIFAICDYYLLNRKDEHSRHLYDLTKLYSNIDFNEEFIKLFNNTTETRKGNKYCPSASDDVNIVEVIDKIIETDFYKSDYNSITALLIIDNISYEDCIKALITIKNKLITMLL